MSFRTFVGGVHPPDNKRFTEKCPIEKADLPRKVIIPLSQHIGAPARAEVAVGDEVLAGQVIGTAGGFVSTPIHSSISGKVVGITNFPHPNGREVMSIFIEGDGSDNWVEMPPIEDFMSLDPSEIKGRILEAGVVGLGGATFPTHVKLSPPKEKKIEWLVLNGAECEPYLTADHRLMVERPDEVVKGIRIIMRALGIEKSAIGIESNKPDAIEAMRAATSGDPGIGVEVCEVKYPQGAEKNLIKAILGREVPSGGLPMDVGVVVQNVGTALAAYEAVALGKPLVERVVTISGPGIVKPRNLMVRIGTLFSDVISQCGGYRDSAGVAKVISGGPMMGVAQYTTDVPVIKGTSGILIFTGDQELSSAIGPCIKCGKCVDGCPMFLMPNLLSSIGERNRIDLAAENRVLDCVECGTCAFVCPSNRPIVHFVRHLKAEMAEARRKEAEAKARKEKAAREEEAARAKAAADEAAAQEGKEGK